MSVFTLPLASWLTSSNSGNRLTNITDSHIQQLLHPLPEAAETCQWYFLACHQLHSESVQVHERRNSKWKKNKTKQSAFPTVCLPETPGLRWLWPYCSLKRKESGGNPGPQHEGSRMAHNEQWAVACCLMGRFIISLHQLIPTDGVQPAAGHQKSRERERRGRTGNLAEVKNDVKGQERWGGRGNGGSGEVKWR